MNLGKRGQITIYIIIAIVIVGVILIYFLYPQVKNVVSNQQISPNSYLQDCVNPQIKTAITTLGKQGGYSDPQGYVMYQGNKVKYLCYTSENYKTCVVQQPFIKGQFQKELQAMIVPVAEKCGENLKDAYEKRGYDVSQGSQNVSVSIVPNNIRLKFNTPMTISKDNEKENYKGFTVDIPSGLYNMLFIAQSMVQYESTYGNTETSLYIQYYPNIRILKNQLEDGARIYTIENVVTNENFTFASRSLVFPPGYGNE